MSANPTIDPYADQELDVICPNEMTGVCSVCGQDEDGVCLAKGFRTEDGRVILFSDLHGRKHGE